MQLGAHVVAPARGLDPGPIRRAIKVGCRATAQPCHAVLRLQDSKATWLQHQPLQPASVLWSDGRLAFAGGRQTDESGSCMTAKPAAHWEVLRLACWLPCAPWACR